MSKWPTVQSLASASLESVQEAWSGLGYYSRARRLHEAAVYITNTCHGRMPRETRDLLTLPGVGRYTASAVASIAHNQVTQHMWDTADQLVDQDRPGEFNQAMMELGAVICSPKSPDCSSFPVKTQCSAYNNNNLGQTPDIEDCDLCLGSKDYNPELGVTNYPRKGKKTASRDQETLVVVVSRISESGTKYLLERRPSKGLLANLLQFPGRGVEGHQTCAHMLTLVTSQPSPPTPTYIDLYNRNRMYSFIIERKDSRECLNIINPD